MNCFLLLLFFLQFKVMTYTQPLAQNNWCFYTLRSLGKACNLTGKFSFKYILYD